MQKKVAYRWVFVGAMLVLVLVCLWRIEFGRVMCGGKGEMKS